MSPSGPLRLAVLKINKGVDWLLLPAAECGLAAEQLIARNAGWSLSDALAGDSGDTVPDLSRNVIWGCERNSWTSKSEC